MALSGGATACLQAGQFTAAYYLSGLAVECALNARIARSFRNDTWPDRKFVQDIHTHVLADLVRQAQLEKERLAEELANAQFRANWNIMKDWRIESRYQSWTATEAGNMVAAATARGDGVLAWIKRHW